MRNHRMPLFPTPYLPSGLTFSQAGSGHLYATKLTLGLLFKTLFWLESREVCFPVVVLWGKFILSSCFVTHISKQGFLLDFTLYFIVLNFHEPFVGICFCVVRGFVWVYFGCY